MIMQFNITTPTIRWVSGNIVPPVGFPCNNIVREDFKPGQRSLLMYSLSVCPEVAITKGGF